MTSFEPIIDRLRVEAFRGFRDAREFDLSAAAVIVTGPKRSVSSDKSTDGQEGASVSRFLAEGKCSSMSLM